MFKPRFLMSHRERRLRDARYGDLVNFRTEVAHMSASDRLSTETLLAGSVLVLKRSALMNLAGVLCLVAAMMLCFGHALLSGSVTAIAVTVLMLPGMFRLLDMFSLSRDTYFGQVRRLSEIRGEPGGQRFENDE